jgi:magnesium-transporting ATPase (P-type)
MVLCKGAPEILQTLLSEVPDNYEEYYSYYVKHGYRVIALASKDLPDNVKPLDISRNAAESNLVFAGFLIFQCPIKEDTLDKITKIKDAGCKIKIITGDNVLTAAYVAAKLRIAENFSEKESAGSIAFAKIKDDTSLQFFDYEDNLVRKFEIKSMNFFALEKMQKP